MQLIEKLREYADDFIMYRELIGAYDILEIFLLTFIVYYILVWMKSTRAWQLMKGLVVIGIFLAVVYFLEMNTIIWVARNLLSFATIAIIVVMQPELRHALEELGKKNFLPGSIVTDVVKKEKERLTDQTISAIVSACFDMGRVKTGALIVIEQNESLKEYEISGIAIDALVSSQLLINIFEHNTPLHDGAVIIRGNRIVAATCYLPNSPNLTLSKELGTRHRAGVGISEVTDSLTIIVSEETGAVSMAYEGTLVRNVEPKALQKKLDTIFKKQQTEEEERSKTKKKSILKGVGRSKHER